MSDDIQKINEIFRSHDEVKKTEAEESRSKKKRDSVLPRDMLKKRPL